MTVLDIEQLRALAQLRRASDAIRAAEAAYSEVEGLCCSLSISTRQIALLGRVSHSSVCRRQRARVAVASRELEEATR